jgi:ankyrin repeat protein
LQPLHWCAYAGHLEVAEMLVKYGANVNLQDASKATPLHLAATKGHTEMASFLLNKGARTDVDVSVAHAPARARPVLDLYSLF